MFPYRRTAELSRCSSTTNNCRHKAKEHVSNARLRNDFFHSILQNSCLRNTICITKLLDVFFCIASVRVIFYPICCRVALTRVMTVSSLCFIITGEKVMQYMVELANENCTERGSTSFTNTSVLLVFGDLRINFIPILVAPAA